MLSILLIATSQVFICSGEAMIDFFRYQVFFRLLLGTVPGVIYSIGETSLVSACRVLLLMFSIFEEKNVYHLSVCLIFGTNILNILVIGFPLRCT